MDTTIQCTTCEKRYSIDSQFAGKRVKCKNCGSRISIPGPNAAADDDPMAGWDDEDDESDLGPPPTFELPEDALPPGPSATTAAPAAPAKPAYLEALAELSGPAVPAAPRLALGERLDAWLPWWAGRIFVAGFLAAAAMPWVGMALHRLVWRSALRDCVVELVALAAFYFAALRLALVGARLGARVAKFEPPPDLSRRVRAALLAPLLIGVAAWLPLTHLRENGRAYAVVKGKLAAVPTMTWSAEPIMDVSAYTPHMRLAAESALGACVVAAFLAYRFFLRPGWKKALVSFLVMAVLFLAGLGVVVGAGWGVAKVMDHFLKVTAAT